MVVLSREGWKKRFAAASRFGGRTRDRGRPGPPGEVAEGAGLGIESPQISIQYRTLSLQLTQTIEEQRQRRRLGDKKGAKGDGIKGKEQSAIARDQFAALDNHVLEVDKVYHQFNTSPAIGLEEEVVQRRLQRDGPNTLTPPPSRFWGKVVNYCFGGFCWLLWIAAVTCLLAWRPLGKPPDPLNLTLAIVLVVVIAFQALFTAYQNWTTSKVMKSISQMLPTETLVLRNGQQQVLSANDLVRGDIVVLRSGDKVPADIRLTEISSDLKFDRSILTGEVEPVSGAVSATDENYLETRNIAFMGTYVTNGRGTGVVVATGDRTVVGTIAKLSAASLDKPTLLQIEISKFIKIIASLATTTAVIIFILWVAWIRVQYPGYSNLPTALVNSIAVLVAFVPEGLPICVTLTLTLVARRMRLQRVLVKNLTAVETLGSVNVICSDKTGTLTKNQMRVVHVGFLSSVIASREFSSETKKLTAAGEADVAEQPPNEAYRQLLLAVTLCNGASFDAGSLTVTDINERRVNGDATDSAILRFVEAQHPTSATQAAFQVLHQIPFNSRNKFMLVLARAVPQQRPSLSLGLPETQQSQVLLVVKGAPDILLTSCTSVLNEKGVEVPLDEENRSHIVRLQEKWSAEGQRVLLVCRRLLGPASVPEKLLEDGNAMEELAYSLNQELCVVGLVGIVDPPREEIPSVVATCRTAGVRVFMVTGDFALTAASIARQCGILTSQQAATHSVSGLEFPPGYQGTNQDYRSGHVSGNVRSLVVSGKEIPALTDLHWDQISLYDEIVFARTTPEQKLKIVEELTKRRNTVAVTGDGVNDAPALKAAHIGVAMGGGSEVAREASAMVLMDNNFSSIVVAIENGRMVFDNLKKVMLYLLPAGSFSEMVPIVVNSLLGAQLPLSAFLMICICVITDVPPSLSLMFEKPELDIMRRSPRNPAKDQLVNLEFLAHAYLFIGIMETLFAHLAFFLSVHDQSGIPASAIFFAYDKWTDGFYGKTSDQLNEYVYRGQSVYFVTLVICQLGNLFATRTRKRSLFQQNPVYGKSTRNPALFIAMVITLSLAVAITELPFINSGLHTRPVPIKFWLLPIPFAFAIFIMDEIRKLLINKFPKSLLAKISW